MLELRIFALLYIRGSTNFKECNGHFGMNYGSNDGDSDDHDKEEIKI